jgi:hypothetical protein
MKIMKKINFAHKRSKLKQADWPLGSKESWHQDLAQFFTKKSYDQKHDILTHNKKITLIVEKGTQRITHDLNPYLVEKTTKSYSSEKHVCSTCKEEVTDISRVLLMRDKDGAPRLLCYHYFFPCWDMELFCQQYPNFIIDKAGFSIPENIQMKENSVKDMQENLELWT